MQSVGRCADIGALAGRRKRTNFAVEEIAERTRTKTTTTRMIMCQGQREQLGLLVGGLALVLGLALEKRAISFSAQEDIKWQFERGRRPP